MEFWVFLLIWYLIVTFLMFIFFFSFLNFRKWKEKYLKKLPTFNSYNKIDIKKLEIINVNFDKKESEFFFFKSKFNVKIGKKTFDAKIKHNSIGNIFHKISFSTSLKKSYTNYNWINIGKNDVYLSNKYIYLKSSDLIQKQVFKYSSIDEIKVDKYFNIYIMFKSNKESIILKGSIDKIELFINLVYTLK